MNELQISGLTPFTTIDYPGKLSAVLFLQGCPLRCAYCSNCHLQEKKDGIYDVEKILQWAKDRVGKIEAVVFSGGEPLLQITQLIPFVKTIKDMGFCIGLHTSGCNSNALKAILSEGIVDWVGLDFKTTKNKYEALTKNPIAYQNLIESIGLLDDYGRPFEIRTTCDPNYVTKQDVIEIAEKISSLKSNPTYAIQRYIPHFESITKKEDCNQFFDDKQFRVQIESIMKKVIWRN